MYVPAIRAKHVGIVIRTVVKRVNCFFCVERRFPDNVCATCIRGNGDSSADDSILAAIISVVNDDFGNLCRVLVVDSKPRVGIASFSVTHVPPARISVADVAVHALACRIAVAAVHTAHGSTGRSDQVSIRVKRLHFRQVDDCVATAILFKVVDSNVLVIQFVQRAAIIFVRMFRGARCRAPARKPLIGITVLFNSAVGTIRFAVSAIVCINACHGKTPTTITTEVAQSQAPHRITDLLSYEQAGSRHACVVHTGSVIFTTGCVASVGVDEFVRPICFVVIARQIR